MKLLSINNFIAYSNIFANLMMFLKNTVECEYGTGLNFSNFKIIWSPNCKNWKISHQQAALFSLILAKNSSPSLKNQSFWKMKKKHPQVFTQGTSVQNFSQISLFLKYPGSGQTYIQTSLDFSSTEVENCCIFLFKNTFFIRIFKL